jgi:UDP-N-acetylmuramate--alanine ligase
MNIYFIGIGGIGVSALAQYYFSKGEKVSGSDFFESEMTLKLKEKGIDVLIGKNKEEDVKDYDLVIYSPAIKPENDELAFFVKKGIKVLSYPKALGELTKDYFTIAVSGTHGKSTTTSLISLILIEAGFDPTVIVGTKLKEFNGSNFREGKSKYLIIEACEHEESFLNYNSDIALILNIEEDHIDYYKNIENVYKAFNDFASLIKKDGILIKAKDLNIETSKKTIDFSLEEVGFLKGVMKVPGEYNLLNALASVKVARALKISDETSLKALSMFKGTWRRFDEHLIGELVLIDDYAHHPTEILAMLKSAREKYPQKKIYCVFQPHQYQRTFFLLKDFINAFKDIINNKLVDRLFLIDIYDVLGREEKESKSKIDSKKLASMVDGIEYVTCDNLFNLLEGGEVIIFMGAGNIYNLSQEFKNLQEKIKML